MRPFRVILCFSICLLSCNDASQPNEDNNQILIDTLTPKKENRNLNSANDGKWLAVKFDKAKGDYYIENPCDGHTPKIEIMQFTLIDDKGMDEPIKYQIEEHANINDNQQVLKLSYMWADGQLTDSIIIKKVEGYEGIYNWLRYPKYNGEPQDTEVNYLVQYNYIANTRVVQIDCPDKKIIETEKKLFD